MSELVGKSISHYRILEEVGRGGMGIVYKAEDTTLKRTVALKFLPAHLNASETDKARFLLEAQAAASLSHPNICTIFGIEEVQDPASSEKYMFIAMELVDGQTLHEKTRAGQVRELALQKAIDIGIQVADGLAAAHEKGIVHRDIKPENIMIRKDGVVQIMDFGLAKLRASRASRLTKEGSTVGTAGYMSPEQVQGQDTDHRSDIFSLGVLLYEMIAGEAPFKGVHETAMLYEIVNVDPAPMSTIKPEIDPELDRIVLECLQKEPDERYNSVKDIAKDLKRFKRESSRQRVSRSMPVRSGISARSAQGATELPQAIARNVSPRELTAWIAAAVFLIGGVFIMMRPAPAPPTTGSVIRSSIVTPDSIYIHSFGALMGAPVLSPDGRRVAFTGITPDGRQAIYVRSLEGLETRLLPGTEGGFEPFWSPDGKMVGFFGAARMKKVDLEGGSPITIANVPNPRGASWGPDGTIVYAPEFQSGLNSVSSDGKGTPQVVSTLDSVRHEGSHRWPFFLPDGKHFLYLARAAAETGEAEGDAVYAAALDGTSRKMLVQSSFNPSYVDGYLLFARNSVLFAQKFNPDALSLEGDPVKLQEGVLTDISYNMAVYTVSQTGILLYQSGTSEAGARPLIVDRTGKTLLTIEDRSEQDQPRFSPDGKQVALYLYDTRSRRSNIWIYDLRTLGRRRLTTRATGDFFPVWSADARRIFFSTGLRTAGEIIVQSVTQSVGQPFLSFPTAQAQPYDCTPDGQTLLLGTFSPSDGKGDLFLANIDGSDHSPKPFQQTKFNEFGGRISRDGKWVAYVSDESGENEVYLKLLSAPGSDAWKVSSGGGDIPVWGASATELIYVNPKSEVVAATLRFSGSTGEVAGTKRLFVLPALTQNYDISADGKTFIITRSLEMQKFPPLTLVMNWEELLRKR